MKNMYDQPPGWYRDPVRPNRHRYWSGRGWIGPVGENLDLWCRVLGHRPVTGVLGRGVVASVRC